MNVRRRASCRGAALCVPPRCSRRRRRLTSRCLERSSSPCSCFTRVHLSLDPAHARLLCCPSLGAASGAELALPPSQFAFVLVAALVFAGGVWRRCCPRRGCCCLLLLLLPCNARHICDRRRVLTHVGALLLQYLAELTLQEYGFLEFKMSLIAAATVLCARLLLGHATPWVSRRSPPLRLCLVVAVVSVALFRSHLRAGTLVPHILRACFLPCTVCIGTTSRPGVVFTDRSFVPCCRLRRWPSTRSTQCRSCGRVSHCSCGCIGRHPTATFAPSARSTLRRSTARCLRYRRSATPRSSRVASACWAVSLPWPPRQRASSPPAPVRVSVPVLVFLLVVLVPLRRPRAPQAGAAPSLNSSSDSNRTAARPAVR